MQATGNTTRTFGFNWFGAAIVTLGIAVGIVIGAAGGTIIDNLPTIGSSGQVIARPLAHGGAHQGEGILSGTSGVKAAIRPYTSDQQGEGLLGGNQMSPVPLVAYTSLAQGEGLLGGLGSRAVLTAPVTAHDTRGSGEGWVINGRPDATPRAHPLDGQGEGWLGNGRP